jgi:hypothetical protein
MLNEVVVRTLVTAAISAAVRSGEDIGTCIIAGLLSVVGRAAALIPAGIRFDPVLRIQDQSQAVCDAQLDP